MAALKPHLAEDGQTTELEEQYFECRSHSDGLGRMDDDPLCPTPEAVIDQSHAGLMQDVYTREVIREELEGAQIHPSYKGRNVVLRVDRPVTGPAWNPFAEVETTSLLSWTAKTGRPSFSLPAGAPVMGGSCPGATAGQSTVDDRVRRQAARLLLPVIGKRQVNLVEAICEYCYATGGSYATGSTQFHQTVRYAWVRRAITIDPRGRPTDNPRESSFVSVMIDGIERADFKLEGEPSQWRGKKFFRIHGSGDFFHPRYLMAWKAVCDHFHPRRNEHSIVFWAPTRIWAMGDKWIQFVSEVNKGDTNLVLRPSAYHVNQHGPDIREPGWASPTTVFHHDAVGEAEGREFDWNCKAYAVEKGPSCRGAVGSDARGNPTKVGCRTCWVHPHLRVNYTLH